MSQSKRLAQRRALLVVECTLQRNILVAQSRQLGLLTGWIGSGNGLFAKLKQLPTWAHVAMAAVVIFIPGRIASLARSGLMLWQFWRNLKAASNED